jgi:hypothetical protein
MMPGAADCTDLTSALHMSVVINILSTVVHLFMTGFLLEEMCGEQNFCLTVELSQLTFAVNLRLLRCS